MWLLTSIQTKTQRWLFVPKSPEMTGRSVFTLNEHMKWNYILGPVSDNQPAAIKQSSEKTLKV